MTLRKHQREFAGAIDGIIAGSGKRTILCEVTPGGGKSALPIIAGRLKTAGKIDAVCWVCPRQSLQDQAERNFLDPFFRNLIGHNLTIRQSTNEVYPCRGLDGFVTTYQAVGVDTDKSLAFEFSRRRYALILDEFHHVEKGGVWHEALVPLVANATYLVLMSGTLERGDGKEIAFIPYTKEGGFIMPDVKPSGDLDYIKYSRADALSEQAIIPLKFYFHDGEIKWIDKDGFDVRTSLARTNRKNAGAAIYSALSTEYANDLLRRSVDHWLKHKRSNPGAKLLVVTANFQHAQKTVERINAMGLSADIATSHDGPAALNAIRRFKFKGQDILVSIAMAYEGFSCKPISHIACLTHIRSTPWIEQMVARAVRIDPSLPYEKQYGHVFAPDDILFLKIVAKIQTEQAPVLKKRILEQRQASLFESVPGPKIVPLDGKLTRARSLTLGGHGTGNAGQMHNDKPPLVKTPAEIERGLRKSIETHVRAYEFNNRYRPGRLNRELREKFGKPRKEMTIAELRHVLEHIKKVYPISRVGRGSGRKRVPTKSVEWKGSSPKLSFSGMNS